MTAPELFDGSIPETYDRYLGPVFFQPFAEELARRVPRPPGVRVLEVACGTGRVTRLLAAALPAGGVLAATDLSDSMLAFARRALKDEAKIAWARADAAALPIADGSVDVVVCQFGLIFVPDKVAAAREAHRVLRPGGTLLLSVWDAIDANPTARIGHETIAGLFPDDPPPFYQIPFGLHDVSLLRSILRDGGFGEVEVERVARTGESPSAAAIAAGLVRGNPVLNMLRERGAADVDAVERAVAEALAREFGDRPYRAPMRALVVTARTAV